MMRHSLKRLSKAYVPGKAYEYYRDKQTPGIGRSMNIFMDRGEGSYLFDTTGKKFLDFCCGIGVTSLGHCHPRLVKVVQNQAGKLWHGQVACGVHTAMAELIDEMETILPNDLNSLFFCSTGAETIEATLRMARNHSKRQNVVVLQGSYHGRTNACLAMTTSKYVYGMGCKPYMPGVIVTPCPYTTQLKVSPNEPVDEMTRRCLAILEDQLFQNVHSSEVALIVCEPVIGEGGYLPMPASYLAGVQAIAKKYGILFALDEVQTGFGRTGSMFAREQVNLIPDFLLFAKGIANGLPLAGVATTKTIAASSPPGTQGGTYSGNAVACACAAEVIRIMRDDGILQNAVERGKELFEGLQGILKRNPSFPMQEVRGRGLMIGMQFSDHAPSGVAGELVNQAFARGLVILNTSKFETIRLIPPLNVTKEQVKDALGIMEESIAAALKAKLYVDDGKKVVGMVGCCATPCYKQPGGGSGLPCRMICERK